MQNYLKLNYDLIRLLLLKIEDITDGFSEIYNKNIVKLFPNYSEIIILYHLKYLDDAGYIERYRHNVIIDITPTGREYLNSVRNQDIWNKTKQKIQSFGDVSLPIITEISSTLIKSSLGI